MLDDLFPSMIKQVHNSLTVHENSRALKFDHFSEFQNVIGDSPSPPSVIIRKSICDSPFKTNSVINSKSFSVTADTSGVYFF